MICDGILLVEIAEQASKQTTRPVRLRVASRHTNMTEPLSSRSIFRFHRWVQATEMKCTDTSIATENLTVPSTGGTEIIVVNLDNDISHLSMLHATQIDDQDMLLVYRNRIRDMQANQSFEY